MAPFQMKMGIRSSKSKKTVDGRVHGRITVVIGLVTLVPALVACATLNDWIFLLIPAGVMAGLIIEPDLDQTMVTSSEWRMLKIPILGWLIGAVWVGYWMPYAMFFAGGGKLRKHRSPLSHWPVLGTAIRMAYLIPLAFVFHFLLIPFHFGLTITGADVALLGCGLALSDAGHFARDYVLSTFVKGKT